MAGNAPVRAVVPEHAAEIERLRERYDDVIVIVSPPRAASTALARVFWEHPDVAYYSHEPFDSIYYNGDDPAEALRHLGNPLVLGLYSTKSPGPGRGMMVVKEMTFQVGRHFEYLARLASHPIIFLLRDPRLTVFSRLRNLALKDPALHKTDLSFPFHETGWTHLASQVAWCRRHGVPHLFVESADFRAAPRRVLGELFARFGLPFYDEQLQWNTLSGLELGHLDGEQASWYVRVLASTGIEKPDEQMPETDVFDRVPGLRKHVEECLETYGELMRDLARIGRA